MANDDQNLEIRISANADEVSAGMDKAVHSVKSGASELEGAFGGLKASAKEAAESIIGSIESIMAPLAAVSAAIATGFAFKAAIDGANEYAGEVRKLSNTLGIGSKEASDLAVSLKLVGLSSDEYTGMAMKLDRQLKANEQSMRAMGVATRDANGNLLPQQELMNNAVSTMMEYAAGTDRNAVSMSLFGRNAESAQKLLKLNADVMERGKNLAKELGMELGGDALESSKRYQMQMAEMGLVVESFEHKLGEALIPALTTLGETFVKIVVSILPVFQAAFEALSIIVGSVADAIKEFVSAVTEEVKYISDAISETFGSAIPNDFNYFETVLNVVKTQWTIFKALFLEVLEEIKFGIEGLVISLKTFALVANDALKLDFTGAKAAWDKGAQELEVSAMKHGQKMVQIAKDAAGKVKAAWTEKPKEEEEYKPKGGSKHFEGTKTGKDDRLSDWKNELQQMHEASEQYNKSTLADDEAFWQAKLATITGGSKQEVALRRSIQSELYQIHKQQAAEELAVETEKIDQKQKLAQLDLASKKEALSAQVAAGDISKTDELAALVNYENEAYAIELKALNDKLALYEEDAKQKQKILNQMEVLEQTHANNVQKIQDQSAQQQAKDVEALFNPITSAIDKSVTGIITGTTTVNRAMLNLGNALLSEVVNSSVKAIATFAAEQIQKLGIYQAFVSAKKALFGADQATEAAGEAATQASKIGAAKSAATQVIPAETAMAAMGAASAVAGIPVVGPAMATAAAESMNLLGTSELSIASASGGYDIPSGVNPKTQLHEEEMVLPAHIANPLRDSLANGGGGKSSDVHFHVNTMDAKGVQAFFEQHKSTILKTVHSATRSGSHFSFPKG